MGQKERNVKRTGGEKLDSLLINEKPQVVAPLLSLATA